MGKGIFLVVILFANIIGCFLIARCLRKNPTDQIIESTAGDPDSQTRVDTVSMIILNGDPKDDLPTYEEATSK